MVMSSRISKDRFWRWGEGFDWVSGFWRDRRCLGRDDDGFGRDEGFDCDGFVGDVMEM